MPDHTTPPGLGSDLHTWSQALCNAMQLGMALSVRGSWIWDDSEWCRAGAGLESEGVDREIDAATVPTPVDAAASAGPRQPGSCYFQGAAGTVPSNDRCPPASFVDWDNGRARGSCQNAMGRYTRYTNALRNLTWHPLFCSRPHVQPCGDQAAHLPFNTRTRTPSCNCDRVSVGHVARCGKGQIQWSSQKCPSIINTSSVAMGIRTRQEFRAAAMEYLFSRLSPRLVHAAECALVELFGPGGPPRPSDLITVHLRFGTTNLSGRTVSSESPSFSPLPHPLHPCPHPHIAPARSPYAHPPAPLSSPSPSRSPLTTLL